MAKLDKPRSMRDILRYFLTLFVFTSASSLSYSQTESSVSGDLFVDIPVVQVGAEFYQIVLEPSGDDWKVSTALEVVNPQFISGFYEDTELTILCLVYEALAYEIVFNLIEAEEETVIFEILNIAEKTGCVDTVPVEQGVEQTFDADLQFVKYSIEDAVQRDAICNDGSEAVYYFRPSQTESANWKIHLQGGGNCSTEEDCNMRANVTAENVTIDPELGGVFLPFTSSLSYPDQLDIEGIFSLDVDLNPIFSQYNHVYIPYCSSDSHYGDRSASAETFGFHFKGKKIISAIVEDLQKPHIIGSQNLAESELVVISGTSAGGRGVQQNLDRMADSIGHENVYGIMDSSYYTHFFLTDEERVGLSKRESDLWNGQYDESCMELLGEDKHLCDRVELLTGSLGTPFFIHMDQYDEVALGENADQAEEFATQLRGELMSLCGVFSGRYGYHGALKRDANFFSSPVEGLTFFDVLSNWLFGNEDEIKTVIEDGVVSSCDQ